MCLLFELSAMVSPVGAVEICDPCYGAAHLGAGTFEPQNSLPIVADNHVKFGRRMSNGMNNV